jgi:hypothetical protein
MAGPDWNQRSLPRTVHCTGLSRSIDYEKHYLLVYKMLKLLLIVFIVAQMVEALSASWKVMGSTPNGVY